MPIPTAPLLRFHLRSTMRLGVRALTPAAAALVAASVLANQPGAVVVGLAAAAVGSDAHPAASLAVLAVVFTVASWMARRTTHGLAAWPRSLPAGDRSQLDAAAVAAAAALLPIPAVLALIGAAAGIGVSPTRTVGLAISAGAAALAAMPVQRRMVTLVLCGVAAWLALEAGSPGIVAAVVLTLVGRSLSGGLARSEAPHRRPLRHTRRFLAAAIARRALGFRIATPFLGAAVIGLVAVAFLANNHLEAAVRAGALRLAAVTAVTVVIAGLAEMLAARRPAWPWFRSLPVPAFARVGVDAALLLAASTPVLVLAAVSAPGPALTAAAASPTIAALGAGSIRRAAVRASGASGEVLAGGLLAAAWIALVPLVAVCVLAGLPAVIAWAAERERRLKATAWHERHHLAAGDPLAWSDQ